MCGLCIGLEQPQPVAQAPDLAAGMLAVCRAVLPKLSRDLKYLAECQGLPAPCLPVTSKQEKSLFTKLAPRCGSDFKAMSVKWAAESDGKQVLNITHFRVLTD